MNIVCGGIYLVNFEPSIGKEYRKIRPALVVQSDEITKNSPLVTVIPISSKTERMESHDILIRKDIQNRLLIDSVLKSHQLSSFDKSRFIHFVGMAHPLLMEEVRNYICKHFNV